MRQDSDDDAAQPMRQIRDTFSLPQKLDLREHDVIQPVIPTDVQWRFTVIQRVLCHKLIVPCKSLPATGKSCERRLSARFDVQAGEARVLFAKAGGAGL